MAGRTMAQSTICPYCNAKLRLSSSSHRPARVKCHACQRSFHPSQVTVNDGTAQSLNQPLADLAHPATRSISGPHETPAPKPVRPRHEEREHPLASPASTIDGDQEPESINPLVANAAFPAEVEARRAARREA